MRAFYRDVCEVTESETLNAFRDVPELIKISRALSLCDTRACNGFTDYQGKWDEAATLKNERKITRLENKAQSIAEKYNATAYHQGDPRGCALYILPASVSTDDYSRGIAIY